MNDRAKPFAPSLAPEGPRPPVMDRAAGLARMAAETRNMARMIEAATPPAAVGPVPVAPARPAQVVVPTFDVTRGGLRQVTGARLEEACQLHAMNRAAWLRHDARTPDAPFVPPFNPAQVAVAQDYRALVEWREGSAMKCASVEAGRGGSGSGTFIDTFIQQGVWLAELHRRIGDGWAMQPRRNMDRGNARKAISTRALVDMVLIGGRDLTGVLEAFGWAAFGGHRKELRLHLCAALDRMMGYRDADATR